MNWLQKQKLQRNKPTLLHGAIRSARGGGSGTPSLGPLPAVPTGLEELDNDPPEFQWDNMGTGVTYEIFRDGVLIGTSSTPTYTDESQLDQDTAYDYQVKSVLNSLRSDLSAVLEITTPA